MAVQNSVINFSKICRLCLMEESVMSSIYKETDKHSSAVPLPLRIMACVSIELNSIDGLPTQICTTCLCQVDGWYKFKDLCETADAVLKKCIKNEPIQLETIFEIRSKAKEIRQFFTSPHLVQEEDSLDSALNQTATVKKPVKDVEKERKRTKDGSGNLFKSRRRTSSEGSLIFKADDLDGDDLETAEDFPLENGRPSEDSFDEEALLSRLQSTSDLENPHDFSSDDDLPLSSRKKKMLLEKNKSNRPKTRKKTSKKPGDVVRYLRTVRTQTIGEDDASFEVMEMKAEEGIMERKKTKTRKTQTPGEQGSGKKRFRIRPAIPSSCNLCDKVYKNSEILRQHMKSHHVTGTIECPSCKLTFTSLRSLKYHDQRKHSNLEPVPCTFCGKKFLDKKYLRIHENIHSQAHHFVCQFCGRKFIMKTNLTVHISRHHTKKSNDFICQICGKAFPFKLYLKKHFKTHTDYKPYQCTYCEAKFRENTLLKKHVNSIHLKLRPFLCQYCQKTFTRSLYLREHLESQHLGIQKKVECSRCGAKFQNRNRLRRHECLGKMEIVGIESCT